MKVLFVHDKDLRPILTQESSGNGVCAEQVGGLAVYLTHLAQGLRGAGWQTAAVSFRDDAEPSRPVDGDHELTAFRYHLRPSVLRQLDRIIEQEDPDVIHLQSMPTLHPLLLRRLLRARPVVWTFHDVSPVCFWGTRLKRPDGALCTQRLGFRCVTDGCYRPGANGGLPGDLLRVLSHPITVPGYGPVARVLAPSRYLARLLVAHGIDENRIETVPLFSRFQPEPAVEPAFDGTTSILFVGRLTKEKGILELLQAMAMLDATAWSLRIVGAGPAGSEAERLVDRTGLADRVSFLGEAGATGLANEYRKCHLVVIPSIAPESFGLVGVEAMSFGKAVVAFASGGVTEWLEAGVNGLLADHRNIDHLGLQLGRLIDSRDLRERFGAAGYRRCLDEFTLDRHLQRMTAVYKAAIAGRSSGVPTSK